MIRKAMVTSLAVCLTSSAASLWAGPQTSPRHSETYSSGHGAATTSLRFHQPTRVSQFLGSTVLDQAGQTVGRLTDLVFNPATGMADLAVISLNLPDQQGRLTAVPWQLVGVSADRNNLVLNVDRSRLASAPTFEANRWPDLTRPAYSQQIYAHYGLAYPAMGGGMMMGSGMERGMGTRPGTGIGTKEGTDFPRPQPDGRSTFPELNPEEKDRVR